MIIPVFYVFTSWLDFADFFLPDWARWIGVVLFAAAAYLLWETHRALGRNWTPTLGLREDHKLITDGIFRTIRHPMYAEAYNRCALMYDCNHEKHTEGGSPRVRPV